MLEHEDKPILMHFWTEYHLIDYLLSRIAYKQQPTIFKACKHSLLRSTMMQSKLVKPSLAPETIRTMHYNDVDINLIDMSIFIYFLGDTYAKP